jgi:type IX secretion system PorP/SprF family membrane protein
MSKKLLTFLSILAVCVSFDASAQDPHFTQAYANPLYLNPAFAGVNRCPSLNINYRNQYPNFGIYQTYSASYDQYVEGMQGGIGILAMRDEAGNGVLTNTEISGIYSYHLEVTRKFTILAGFQATLRQRGLNWGDFRFPDEIDPFFGFVRESQEVAPGQNTNTHFDVSTGFIGFTERFYIGVAAHHLTQPDEAFFTTSQLPLKLTTHMGFSIPLGRKRLNNSTQNFLIPNVVYQLQGSNNQLTISTSFSRGPLSGGLGFRTSDVNPDALVLLLGFAPQEGAWKIGYSYDLTISEQQNSFGGAHEISLAYQFPCRVRKRQNRAIKCPKF